MSDINANALSEPNCEISFSITGELKFAVRRPHVEKAYRPTCGLCSAGKCHASVGLYALMNNNHRGVNACHDSMQLQLPGYLLAIVHVNRT